MQDTLQLTVTAIEGITRRVMCFTLAAPDGGVLPSFTSGSHILVHLQKDGVHFANAYSLLNAPSDSCSYRIAVQLEEPSRGGSHLLHTRVRVGDLVEITPPRNAFALSVNASHHLLIAGGIGITPILSHSRALHAAAQPHEVHYAFRSAADAPFANKLHNARLYDSAAGHRMDIPALLAAAAPGTHVYACGPQRLLDEVCTAAQASGIDAGRIHIEQFGAPASASGTFTVVLARSGMELQVAPGGSILSAIEKCGAAHVDSLCRAGVCGTCETAIVEGEAEHLDQYLTPQEQLAQKTMLVCVSRARGSRIVLDL